jgi:hypothetical protein
MPREGRTARFLDTDVSGDPSEIVRFGNIGEEPHSAIGAEKELHQRAIPAERKQLVMGTPAGLLARGLKNALGQPASFRQFIGLEESAQDREAVTVERICQGHFAAPEFGG